MVDCSRSDAYPGYDRRMATLVLTVIGDDRAGLVNAVAQVVARHGGNWERSQMAELAGKFAGIVLVTVPDSGRRRARRRPRTVARDARHHRPGRRDRARPVAPACSAFVLDLIGTDRPGIVREITDVLAAHAVNIDTLRTETRDAPMSGGRLFEATPGSKCRPSSDMGALRVAFERLANELMVDIELETPADDRSPIWDAVPERGTGRRDWQHAHCRHRRLRQHRHRPDVQAAALRR